MQDDRAKVERGCENKVSGDRESQRDNCWEGLNIPISATFDFERALGGPQVQLSQARRHLTGECNPSLQSDGNEKAQIKRWGKETIRDD